MSSKRARRPRRGRRVDATGRSIGEARHVRLYHWLLYSAAWRSLSPQTVAVYILIAQRYNGSNNGEISLSVREAARFTNIAKDTAAKSLHELEAKGFIRRHVFGSFNWKLRHASTWILTEFPVGDTAPTRDFMRWTPEKSEAGPEARTDRPNSGTVLRAIEKVSSPLSLIWDNGLGSARQPVPIRGTHMVCQCHAQKHAVQR